MNIGLKNLNFENENCGIVLWTDLNGSRSYVFRNKRSWDDDNPRTHARTPAYIVDAKIILTLRSVWKKLDGPGHVTSSSKGSLRVVYSHAAPGTVPDIYGIVAPRSATFVLLLRHISATFYGGLLPLSTGGVSHSGPSSWRHVDKTAVNSCE